MEGSRFDDLSKAVARVRTRRGLLRVLAVAVGGVVVGATGLSRSDAAVTCRHGGGVCRKGADCCSGACLPSDQTGRRRCSC